MCGTVPSCSHLCKPSLLCCAWFFVLCHVTGQGGPLLEQTLLPSLFWPAATLVLHISPQSAPLTALATPSYRKETMMQYLIFPSFGIDLKDKRRRAFGTWNLVKVFFVFVFLFFLPVLLSLTGRPIKGFSPSLMIPNTSTNYKSVTLSQLHRTNMTMASVNENKKWGMYQRYQMRHQSDTPTWSTLSSARGGSSGGCGGEQLASPGWRCVYGPKVDVKDSVLEYSIWSRFIFLN